MSPFFRKFLQRLPAVEKVFPSAWLLAGLVLILVVGGAGVSARDIRPVLRLSASQLNEHQGFQFPRNEPVVDVVARLQAMNIVPVQDGGLALQWHLLSWPNPWFDRFPLTLDQNLSASRSVYSEENSYWTSHARLGRRHNSASAQCPQTNPQTPSSSKLWDSSVNITGTHTGEVWLSDSMADLEHNELRGHIDVVKGQKETQLMADAHGTHVSGVMSALRNGEGTVGVVPGLKVLLFPLKLLSTEDGPRVSGRAILENLDSIIGSLIARKRDSERTPRVILLSWSVFESDGVTSDFLQELELRIRKILSFDVAVVVPSGNLELGRKSADHRVFPAEWASQLYDATGSLLPVASLDVCSRPAWFAHLVANELGTVLVAPGERIYSTLPNDDYGFMTGSSAAAAQVAAVLSMTAFQYPEVEMKEQVRTLLRTSVPVSHGSERVVSFEAPSLVQGLMAEYGWIARH